jgi:hypothetical protein
VTLRSESARRTVLVVCLALSAPAFGQSGEAAPSPAATAQTKDDRATTEPPRPIDPNEKEKQRAARPGAKERPRRDERIRLDAPVSFPVDI